MKTKRALVLLILALVALTVVLLAGAAQARAEEDASMQVYLPAVISDPDVYMVCRASKDKPGVIVCEPAGAYPAP